MRQQQRRRAVVAVPFWFSLAVGLTACATTDFQQKRVVARESYSFVAPAPDMAAFDEKGGLSFRDATLNQLLAAGVEGNMTVAIAKERVREARAGLRRAGGGRFSGDANLQAANNSITPDSSSLSLGSSFSPFGLGRARLAAADARLDAAELGALEARRVIMSEIASSYVELRFLQQLLIYRKQDLGSRRAILRDVTTQSEAGRATRVDLLQTRAQLAEARVEIPVLEASIVQTRNQISTLLGKPVGTLNIDLGFKGEQPHPHGRTNVGVPADMIRARPDIQQAERQYAAALADIDAAKAARYPRLSLTGSIRAPLEGDGETTQSLAAGLIVPIFSQEALAADIDSANSRAEQAFLQWRNAVLSAVENVESSLIAMQGAQKAVAASREVVALNREALQLSRDLLASGGNITVLDVLDRERAVSDSQIVFAQNQRGFGLNYVALRTALGIEPIPETVQVVQ